MFFLFERTVVIRRSVQCKQKVAMRWTW